MELLSEVQAAGEPRDPVAKAVLREALELGVQMLGPFAPHIAEEMWRKLGRTEPTLFRVPWPAVDPAALEVAEVEIAVQVNRKVRARTTVRKGLTETEVLLVFIGGVFVIEAVTWIIQIASFKRWGRRVFLIVPIHHHFEMKAWSETKIMVRFWIVGAILCAIGFVLYYRYYLRFQL